MMYFPNPNVWAPPESERIFTVLVPANETQLSQNRYLELLSRRLEWLISMWREEAEASSVMETHQMLWEMSREFSIYQRRPRIPTEPLTPEAIQEWQVAWARFLVFESDIIAMRRQFLPISFPVPVETDSDRIEELLCIFNTPDVQPNLEQWLAETINPMLR